MPNSESMDGAGRDDKPLRWDAIFDEIRARYARGEDIDIEAYASRYPEIAPFLRDFHEELKAGTPSSAMSLALGSYFCGTPRPLVGDEIRRYKLLEEIGRGAFGIVFRALETYEYRREVALKVLIVGSANEFLTRYFREEWQVLAGLSHSGIAQIYDAGFTEDGRYPFCSMEYIEGSRPVDEFCDDRHLTVDRRLELFLRVCNAVQYAHGEGRGVLHRDLKPGNVLVKIESSGIRDLSPGENAGAATEEWVPKVIDFGLAKALRKATGVNTQGVEITVAGGTYGYMSPEQAEQCARTERGRVPARLPVDTDGVDPEGTTASVETSGADDPLNLDARTDVYSLGAILYELLTGSTPFALEGFRGRSHSENAEFLRKTTPQRPSARVSFSSGEDIASRRGTSRRSLVHRLRGDLDAVVLKALAPAREDRYASVSDLVDDIRRYRDHRPVQAAPCGVLGRTAKMIRRHWVIGLSAALTLSLLVGFALYSRFSDYLGMRALLSKARSEWESYGALRERADSLHKDFIQKQDSRKTWYPPWDPAKKDYLTKLVEWRKCYRQMGDHFQGALLDAHQAMDLTGFDWWNRETIREFIGKVYSDYYDQLHSPAGMTYSLEFFRHLARVYSPEADRDSGLVTFRFGNDVATLADLTIHCYRHEDIGEGYLAPLPFNPATGEVAADLPLVVARTRSRVLLGEHFRSDEATILPGDRVVEVNGQPVFRRGDLADALAGVGYDDPVELLLDRPASAEPVRILWIPFPRALYRRFRAYEAPYAPEGDDPDDPPRVINIWDQFGLLFEGYPLVLRGENRLDPGLNGSRFEHRFPRGSYLLRIQAAGFAGTRVPFLVPREGAAEIPLRLVRSRDIPPGFIYVPEGEGSFGGDLEADQPLPYESRAIDGFVLGKYEVTLGEWKEFINDPDVNPRIARDPASEDFGTVSVKGSGGTEQRVRLIPRCGEDCDGLHVFAINEEGQWDYYPGNVDSPRLFDDLPVFSVSNLAAREYASWLTKKHHGRWRFRLPTDHEWEKAARGVDRRPYVWGFHPMWSFCCSSRGHYTGDWSRIGLFAMDESVYGVRDMAGLLREHTSDITVASDNVTFYSCRGGSFLDVDDLYFRICTRNGLPAYEAGSRNGFRLAASLPGETP